MWFNVYYVWKAFILNYSMAEKCGQIDRMHNYLIYRGRKWGEDGEVFMNIY